MTQSIINIIHLFFWCWYSWHWDPSQKRQVPLLASCSSSSLSSSGSFFTSATPRSRSTGWTVPSFAPSSTPSSSTSSSSSCRPFSSSTRQTNWESQSDLNCSETKTFSNEIIWLSLQREVESRDKSENTKRTGNECFYGFLWALINAFGLKIKIF